jgi:hypothetical protein
MRRRLLALLLAAAGTAALVASMPARTGPARPALGQGQEPPVVCGFRNPSYAGLCEERAPYETGRKLEAICKPILDCLNDTRCIKTYCGSTTIRQGWVLESAKRAEKQELPW